MKSKLISILKVIIPLGIGFYVIWYQYDQLTDEQITDIKNSFVNASYFWIILSVFFGILSHLSRAYRWKYTLEPLGYKTRFINNFFGVMIGYVANIILPRLGEVWRCVMVSRYEKEHFVRKLFGTVVAERVADMVILALIVITVVIMQLSRLKESIEELISGFLEANSLVELITKLAAAGITLSVGSIVFWRLIQRSDSAIFLKTRSLLRGLADGLLSIFRMKKKWAFLFHTAFIWTMYLAMFYVPFLALPGTANTPVSGILASL